MRKDNRGISLIELIIVIAIMTIITGGVVFGIGWVSGKPAMKCAQKIMYSLERHRTTAMGKLDAEYKLYTSGNRIYVKETIKSSESDSPYEVESMVGENGVTVAYQLVGEAETHDLDGAGITFKFARGSGSFLPTINGKCCSNIYVHRAGATYTLKLEPLTGKVYIE